MLTTVSFRFKPLFYTVVFIVFLIHPTKVYGDGGSKGASDWSIEEKRWLLSLTYPDEDKNDFGKEISESDRALLKRFKPEIFVSPHGLLPVDFYRFYLPNTVVRDICNNRRIVRRSPTREFLKSIERNRCYYLDYTGPPFPCKECSDYIATGYGRVFREVASFRVSDTDIKEIPIVVLKYSFAFPYSGLPARLGFLKEAAVRIVADPERWHELDIHGAIHIILNRSLKPMVLLLAQHNHFRSYVIGRDINLTQDGRISICFAERSNEPYPCPEGKKPIYYRAVGNPANIPYVIDGTSKPMFSGEDMVYGPYGGGEKVIYILSFLPDKDPLYVSWIPLGDRQSVPFLGEFYRKGPPGMDLNTWPELKRYGDIMQFWYLRDGSHEDAKFMKDSMKGFFDVDFDRILKRNGRRLYYILKEMGYVD